MLKLKLENLTVESFSTGAFSGRGTVEGHVEGTDGPTFAQFTCGGTCPATCPYTCENTCDCPSPYGWHTCAYEGCNETDPSAGPELSCLQTNGMDPNCQTGGRFACQQ